MIIKAVNEIPKRATKGSEVDVRGLTLSCLKEFVDTNERYGQVVHSAHHCSPKSIYLSIRWCAEKYGLPIKTKTRGGVVYLIRTDMPELGKKKRGKSDAQS